MQSVVLNKIATCVVQEDELRAALALRQRFERTEAGDEDGAERDGPVSLGQLHLRDKMLREEEEEDAAAAAGAAAEGARMHQDGDRGSSSDEERGGASSEKRNRKAHNLEAQATATSRPQLAPTKPSRRCQSSVVSYIPVPLDGASGATRAAARAAGAIAAENDAGTSAALSSQDCFPSSGSLPGGTREGDFLEATALPSKLAKTRRGSNYKCCAQCGRMANSNRSKTCAACGCLEFVARSKLRRNLKAATPAAAAAAAVDATHHNAASMAKRANVAKADTATATSRARFAAAPAAAACPLCVAGSGKKVGHRGVHKRSLSKCELTLNLSFCTPVFFFSW